MARKQDQDDRAEEDDKTAADLEELRRDFSALQSQLSGVLDSLKDLAKPPPKPPPAAGGSAELFRLLLEQQSKAHDAQLGLVMQMVGQRQEHDPWEGMIQFLGLMNDITGDNDPANPWADALGPGIQRLTELAEQGYKLYAATKQQEANAQAKANRTEPASGD